MKDMIGYCGLDCEKCDAYIATVNDDQALREKTAKLWAELNNAPILPEHINCEGCRANGAKTVFCEHRKIYHGIRFGIFYPSRESFPDCRGTLFFKGEKT